MAADAGTPRIAFRLGQSGRLGLLACTMSQAVVKRGGRRGQASISLCCSTMARGGLRRCLELTKWTINEAPWQAVVMNTAARRTPLFYHDEWWTGREPRALKSRSQEFLAVLGQGLLLQRHAGMLGREPRYISPINLASPTHFTQAWHRVHACP